MRIRIRIKMHLRVCAFERTFADGTIWGAGERRQPGVALPLLLIERCLVERSELIDEERQAVNGFIATQYLLLLRHTEILFGENDTDVPSIG
jgi:hypothetical protein